MEKIEVLKLESDVSEPDEIKDIVEDRQVNDITLRFMMNRELYENYILKNEKKDGKETRFYRDRIFQLAKILLLNEKERDKYFEINPNFHISSIHEEVIASFEDFIQNAIENFKINDTNDLYKQDVHLEEEKTSTPSKYMEYPINQKQNTLDSFVIKETSETIILPTQKKIDLRDPIFRKKGLRKNVKIL